MFMGQLHSKRPFISFKRAYQKKTQNLNPKEILEMSGFETSVQIRPVENLKMLSQRVR